MVLRRIRQQSCLARGRHREITLSGPCSGAQSPGLLEIFRYRAPAARLRKVRSQVDGRSYETAIAVFAQSCAPNAGDRSRPGYRNNHAGKPAVSSERARRSVTCAQRARAVDEFSSPKELNATTHGNRLSIAIDGDVSENPVRDADPFSAHVALDPDFYRDRH
jgi:hypothetical protein